MEYLICIRHSQPFFHVLLGYKFEGRVEVHLNFSDFISIKN